MRVHRRPPAARDRRRPGAEAIRARDVPVRRAQLQPLPRRQPHVPVEGARPDPARDRALQRVGRAALPRLRPAAAAVRRPGAAVAAEAAADPLRAAALVRGGRRGGPVQRVRPDLDPRPARPLLRVRAPEGPVDLLRHGLDLGRALDPGHLLRLRSSLLGRVQRRVRPVRVRQGRHGRDHRGACHGGPPPRGRDPARLTGGQGRRPGRLGGRDRARVRRRDLGGHGDLERRPEALAAAASSTARSSTTSSSPRSRASTSAARWPGSTC